MFYLYHHHDLARLADLLTALRRTHVTSPLATDSVLIPNAGLGRWLKMHLAERDGIAANVASLLPAPFFWQVVAGSLSGELAGNLSGERPDSSAYRRENLRWHLYARLPDLALEVPEIGRYLSGQPTELRRWQLAERLADLFDEYLIYRREMLLDWERGAGDARPPANWQAPLWRALVARLGPDHRARLLGEFIRRIESGTALDTTAWPERLYCFALGNLPPDYLRLLYAMAHHCDVHFLMHNPSEVYWGDIERRPVALDHAADGEPPPGEQAVFEGHPLLAGLGYAGRDFLRLIYSDEFAGIREFELGEALAYAPPGADTLLHRLQSGVIRMEAVPTAAGRADDDRSFQVHACHGILREVQVLHDQLLDLLTRDPTLHPRDVIVMTPNVAGFAPAIEAVFGAAEGPASIPFNLSDQPRRGSHPIVLTFRALLDLPLWRWTASELTALVAVPAVMRRYDLEEADVANVQRWIESAGIRWGLDAEHRAGTGAGHWAQNSWSFGLDRLLAGVALADPEALADGVAPVVDLEGGATAGLGQLWMLIERLRHWREALPMPAPAATWQERLNGLCADLFRADPDDREEIAALQTVTDAVAALGAAVDCIADVPLSWEAVREIVDGELNATSPRQPFLAGGVSFCGLVPLRTVPFRVVCLLGMNEGDFPRQDRNRSINLIRRHPRLGDASTRDDDRLLLLQWLLAARDVFYLSYTGQDTASGEALAPSTVVAELLDFVARDQFAGTSRNDALARLVTRQPMQPFSPRYFGTGTAGDASRVFTFRGAWGPGTLALFGERGVLPTLIDDSRAHAPALQQVGLDELKRFFEHPARYFLREVLQLDLEIASPGVNDEEPLAGDWRDQSRLRLTLFAIARIEGPLPDEPSALVRARGVLPPPPLDVEPYRKLATELNALLPVWQHARGADEPEVVAVDVQLPSGLRIVGRLGDVHPEGLRRVDARQLGAAQLLSHWIDLLALAAGGRAATLTCAGFGANAQLELRRGSIDPATALARLDSLATLYREGQQRPLCFLPALGLRYLEYQRGAKPLEPDAALRKCNDRLANDFQPAWEARDVWFAQLLAAPPLALGEHAEESEFCRIATQVLDPMQDALAPQAVDAWLAGNAADAGGST